MFSDKISIKSVLVSLIGYIIVATVAMIVVVQLWIPAGITDPTELSRLAEADPKLLMWQYVLGTVLTVLAGFAAGRISGGKGLKNSLILGILLVLYGVLGIYLHPSHPGLMQIAKIVAPIPLALVGGWFAARRTVRT